jgi:AcrR family transcriptional regulator
MVTAKTLEQRSAREIDIIRSTYRMMAHLGSHRLTLIDIAAEAGVSKALILYHFGTKDALLHTTMQWVLERTADRIRQRLEPDMSGAEAMTALIDAVFVDAEANRDFFLFYLDLVEHAARVPEFGELFSMLTEIINGLYAEVIEAGARDGSFQVTDTDRAARHMRSLIEGTFLQWMQTDDWRSNHSQWRDACREAILGLLGAPSS